MWQHYVEWLAVPGNRKYFPLMTTIGRNVPDIPLYVFLAEGVVIIVANTSVPTVVTNGGLKTAGGDPFGGAVVNVRYEQPGVAIGYTTGGTSGPSAASIAAAIIGAMNATPPDVNAKTGTWPTTQQIWDEVL